MNRKTTTDLLKKKQNGEKIVMVTAYDFTFARLVDRSGVDMVLVGDSLGMVVQGQPDTLSVSMDEMIYHTRCVGRGIQNAHLVGDMPFMSYQVSPEQALTNAARFLKEAGAQSVKLEGGVRTAPAIARLVEAGIPVVGHVGLTPQSVHAFGGFRVQGRSEEGAQRIVEDAFAVAEAGAFCLVLEGIPSHVAAQITQKLSIPTIGIGAGSACDGQVLVVNDLLGMNLEFKPKFVKRYAQLQNTILAAVETFGQEVRDGHFPSEEYSFSENKK